MQQDNTPTYVEEQQPVVQNDNNSQVCVEEQPIVRDEPQGNYNNRGVSDNGMVTIPGSTSLDYSSNVTQAQGVVSSLTRYLQDGQVIYCVNLDISVGATTTPVHYYCGYNVYSQVSVGDILNVEYQQVSDNCFSVCTISK